MLTDIITFGIFFVYTFVFNTALKNMFFAKKYTKASLASIGSQIGKRDHATVLHACKTVDNLSSTDKQFKKYVDDLAGKLSN